MPIYAVYYNGVRREFYHLSELVNYDDIRELNCSNNELTALPSELPRLLQILNCSNNKLTALPKLPSTLRELNCSNNEIIELPELPLLKEIIINKQETEIDLTEILDDTKEKLMKLISNDDIDIVKIQSAFSNMKKSIVGKPQNRSLEKLDCSYNELEFLPELPNELKVLNCNNNNLVELPSLSDSIIELNCSNNNLTYLPRLKDSIIKIAFCYFETDRKINNIFK